MTNASRPEFLKAGGLVLAGSGIAALFGPRFPYSADPEMIEMRGQSDWIGVRGLHPLTQASAGVGDNYEK